MESQVASTPLHLFTLRNIFYLWAYQAAINCSDSLLPLSPEESIEKESPAFRSYISLGSYPIFIKMHRVDYAEKQLRIIQQIDEDRTLTQLANAWFDMAVGGSKVREAYLIFQDFLEKYLMTGLVLNGKAVCCILMGNFDEAETFLLETLNKDTKDPETLANLVVCRLHLGKPASRYLSQLKLSNPYHILVKQVSSAEESFDRAVQIVA